MTRLSGGTDAITRDKPFEIAVNRSFSMKNRLKFIWNGYCFICARQRFYFISIVPKISADNKESKTCLGLLVIHPCKNLGDDSYFVNLGVK